MPKVKVGIDRINEYLSLFDNQRVGLITNPTGIDSQLHSTIDILNEKTNLVALFSPEHGVRGDIQAGIRMDSYVDKKTNCMVYSLYGKDKKPSPEMLGNLDVIVFDIQDVGARYYTYLYTMAYAMIAAAENNKKFIVFDRPNPVGGVEVEGNILDLDCRSFVGYYPIPQRYGLTVGELALFFNKEYSIDCQLTVVPMKGYERSFNYNQTGLSWVLPSPNIPNVLTTYAYLATCYFEGTNVSEGRGTTKPFEIFGAPWLDADQLIEVLSKQNLEGVRFRKTFFTPMFSKYTNELCEGIELVIDDVKSFKPVKTGMTIIYILQELSKDFKFLKPYKEGHHPMIDLLNGDVFLREHTLNLKEIYIKLTTDSQKFIRLKGQYHLYD